jgi:hypothetical protein
MKPFTDWLSMKQSHEERLPLLHDGVVQGIDQNGQLIWETKRGFQFEGSFETRVQISCDGHTVRFSGNPSRFGRPDNVFGFDLPTSIRRINEILGRLGLPPFTAGRRLLRPSKRTNFDFGNLEADQQIRQLHLVQPAFVQVPKHSNESIVDVEWTGARFMRIDSTQNYFLGSPENARHYLQWLFTQQPSRQTKVGTYPDGTTVDWGRGSRRIYAKFYLKFLEMQRGKVAHDPALVEWAAMNGLGRFEISLKSTQLQTMGMQFLGSLDMDLLDSFFEERASILTRASIEHDNFSDLPAYLRCVARDYLAGDDMSKIPLSTFKRKRKALLAYGIDIAVPRNVYQFQPRVRVIELKPAHMPVFYQLDERLAA